VKGLAKASAVLAGLIAIGIVGMNCSGTATPTRRDAPAGRLYTPSPFPTIYISPVCEWPCAKDLATMTAAAALLPASTTTISPSRSELPQPTPTQGCTPYGQHSDLPQSTPTLSPTVRDGLRPSPTPLPSTGSQVIDGHFLLLRPIAPPGNDWVDPSYAYGSTAQGVRQPHHGVEFYNASGTPILASADGSVVVAGNDQSILYSPWKNFYGNLIVLEHHLPGVEQTVYTLYAHLSKIEVTAGQTVEAGDRIGLVGATGSALGSHLHFEVRLGKNTYQSTRNPVLWLVPDQEQNGRSAGVLAVRVTDEAGKLLQVTLSVQYFPDPDQPPARTLQPEAYAIETVNGDDVWGENYALTDLQAGQYRISFLYHGVLYEQRVSVEPGKLTLVNFLMSK
jgi:murein DD-endopeptidase MepM/ murein hydrolase activator NlpD